MTPILFTENSTVFTSNGIGRLSDAISCKVEEERNGIYELEMQYPMSGQHYSDIVIRNIIVAKPSANASLQAFRIYKVSRPINGKVTVYAQHISYDLTKNTCMPFSVSASSSACNTVLQGLKSNAVESCLFTFWTDVTTVASYSQIIPASIRQRLGGIEGSVLDQFGGEYEWDNYTVKLHRQRGAERDITLRYGKNITDIQQEENISETITGVVPYWINVDGTDSRTLPEKAVYSSHASAYSTRLTAPLDLSQEWEEKPTEVQLRTAAQVYVNRSGFGIPKVSVQVSFVNLADTEEYKDILPLENVNLCDIIKVQFEKLGIDTTAEIVKTTYDVLKEKYISVEIGELRSNFASTINQLDADTALAISNTGKTVFAQAGSAAQDAVNNATAWLTGSNGYVVAIKNADGSWKELLFMDTNDVQTARNVLRMNENGIGFSRNGVGGPYTNAWTIDGNLVADFITTGLLKSASGENYWDLDTGEFCLTSTSKVRVTDTNYTGTVFPNAYNYPASSWTTYAEKTAHVGETYKNTNTGKYYKWQPKDTKVHFKFSSPSATEKNYDYVEIYYQQNGKWYKSGKFDGGWNGSTNNISDIVVNVPVSDFYIYWKSDGSNVDWGFQIDTIGGGYSGTTSYTEYDSDPRPSGVTWTYTPTGSGIGWPQTSHNYGNNESIGWEFDLTPTYGQFGWVEYDPVKPLGEYVEDTADLDLDQESVFNALTNNGQNQGLYLQNGKVYLNAEYMGTGALKIGGSGHTAIPSIIVQDANNNTIFQANASAVTWNATNSSMDSNGKITASNAELTGGYIKLGGTSDGKIEMYNSSNQKVGEWTRDRLRFQNGSSNTIDLMKDGGNSVIKFDSESYIDGTGTGTNGGINFNARKCVFSVNDLGVTSSRGSSTVRYGRDGDVITSLSTSTLEGICCNLRGDGRGFSWDIVDIEYVSGYGYHNTVNGLVVS